MGIKKYLIIFTIQSMILLMSLSLFAQFPPGTNAIESNVIPYKLPAPLVMADGRRVTDSMQWQKIQRPYLYHLFEEEVYGRIPRQPVPIRYQIREQSNEALHGEAIRKQVRIFPKPDDTTVYIDVLIYLPAHEKKPVPVFLGLNFMGNATIQNDPAIFLSERLASPNFTGRNTDADRGKDASSWPVKQILANGIGVVTAYTGDMEEDNPDGWQTGIRSTLKNFLHIRPDEWGAISAWAWGLCRIMDYLEQDKDINAEKVALIGHSRLGKTALWAGASDRRFSIVISNESGEGGAALARRWYGETIELINKRFPHWFINAYKKYNEDVFSLPVDQHELLALIAPRPLYVASAEGDRWSDPKGEFLSAVHAGPVYKLFGKRGLETDSMPPVDQPIGHTIHYHIRKGKHDITLYDWKQYIKFSSTEWNYHETEF